ncbi:hypothetical protein DsansV1_C29g0210781 [Dioscorea sansibarensis]
MFMPPKWSLGYHQCCFNYDSDEMVLKVLCFLLPLGTGYFSSYMRDQSTLVLCQVIKILFSMDGDL